MRDSHGLFDYESKLLARNSIKASSSGNLIRTGNECSYTSNEEPPSESAVLMSVLAQNGEFTLVGHKKERLWAVVGDAKNAEGMKGLKVSEGDFIKLGRVRFRVKELKSVGEERSVKEEGSE